MGQPPVPSARAPRLRSRGLRSARPGTRRPRTAGLWLAAVAVALAVVLALPMIAGAASAQLTAAEPAPPEPTIGDIVATTTRRSFEAITSTSAELAVDAEPQAEVHCPAPGSEFIDSWGFSRSGGRRHKGVDMMAARGTPVLAPVGGIVRHSRSRLGGIGFHLLDAAGNEYYGSHLDSVGASGWVEAGAVLGTVGSTGNASSSSPHLHFEVKTPSEGSVNPYPYAAFFCGRLGLEGGGGADVTE